MKTQCPVCGSVWAIDSQEYEWQACDACGYPDIMDNETECDVDEEPDYDDTREELIMKHGINADPYYLNRW